MISAGPVTMSPGRRVVAIVEVLPGEGRGPVRDARAWAPGFRRSTAPLFPTASTIAVSTTTVGLRRVEAEARLVRRLEIRAHVGPRPAPRALESLPS